MLLQYVRSYIHNHSTVDWCQCLRKRVGVSPDNSKIYFKLHLRQGRWLWPLCRIGDWPPVYDMRPSHLYNVNIRFLNDGLYMETRLSFGMMTTSNGNIFRITDPLCGEFTGHRWIPLTKAGDVELWCFLWSAPSPVNSPHKGRWRGALMFSLICAWLNRWVNNREAGDLTRHRAHYDANVMDIHPANLGNLRSFPRRCTANALQGPGRWRRRTADSGASC